MNNDKIETIKRQLNLYFADNHTKYKFTIQYNGECLIAIFKGNKLDNINLNNLPDFISGYEYEKNRISFHLSNTWIKQSTRSIKAYEYNTTDVGIYSQIRRLDKQIDFNLTGGTWTEEMFVLARNILYFLHTKSESIQANTIIRCKRLYNELQIKAQIPKELIVGYKNALTTIAHSKGT
ncbi:MAG: hypothetical protein KAQ68_08765 [Clostridiales bacterium]|nr:hypothetical protein [Clostridiales bacterium]